MKENSSTKNEQGVAKGKSAETNAEEEKHSEILRPLPLNLVKIINENWEEIRLRGLLPERRKSMVGGVYNDRLYIYGGYDIKEGEIGNLWALKLKGDQGKLIDQPWSKIPLKGKYPATICRHAGAIHEGKLYIFGGQTNYQTHNDFFFINLITGEVKRPKVNESTGVKPPPIDSHTIVYSPRENHKSGAKITIFGGYLGDSGEMTNGVYEYNIDDNKWNVINAKGAEISPRVGHSAVYYEGAMYVFGGLNQYTLRLNDLWKFGLNNYTWEQIYSSNSIEPLRRSGHIAVISKGKMLIFGGIAQSGWERNDLYAFTPATNSWECIHDNLKIGDPIMKDSPNTALQEAKYLNEIKKKSKQRGDSSPFRSGGKRMIGSFFEMLQNNSILEAKSPGHRKKWFRAGLNPISGNSPDQGNKSPFSLKPQTVAAPKTQKPRNMSSAQRIRSKSQLRGGRKIHSALVNQSFCFGGGDLHDKPCGYIYEPSSPTTNAMKNSAISHSSGEKVYRRKKAVLYEGPAQPQSGLIQGKVPLPRDGAFGEDFNGKLILFGGDRYRMGLNDIFAYP